MEPHIFCAYMYISIYIGIPLCYCHKMSDMVEIVFLPVIQKILKMKKGRDGEKVNKQDGMPM